MGSNLNFTFTSKQQEVADTQVTNGKVVVYACPGSGKTFTIAGRLANLLPEWQSQNKGIAILSHTNTAWKEIKNKLENNFAIDNIGYPHFLGTIDSFVNNFLFLPFGHKIFKINTRPHLVGGHISQWSGKDLYSRNFDNCSFDFEGKIFLIDRRKCPNHIDLDRLKKCKLEYNKKGYFTQDDALFFSYFLLKKNPKLAKFLVNRFPVFIIDEAQDSSKIQDEILNIFIEAGLQEILMVGDPFQAIFEFQDAKPQLFIDKKNKWKSINLLENFRSSQVICDFYQKLVGDEKYIARNENLKSVTTKPIIVSYEDKFEDLLDNFLIKCNKAGIPNSEKNRIVLCRSKGLISTILGHEETNTNPWLDQKEDETIDITRDLALGKFYIDNGENILGFNLIRKALCKQLHNKNVVSQQDIFDLLRRHDYYKYKIHINKIINSLPKTNVTIGEWINKSNQQVMKNRLNFSLKIKKDRKNHRYSYLNFQDIFNKNSNKAKHPKKNLTLRTIHSAKGEDLDAVLIILKSKASNGMSYKNVLKSKILECEEKRTLYVAMSRASRLLMIATPSTIFHDLNDFFDPPNPTFFDI